MKNFGKKIVLNRSGYFGKIFTKGWWKFYFDNLSYLHPKQRDYLKLRAVYIKDQSPGRYLGSLSEYAGYPSTFDYHYTLSARNVDFTQASDAGFYLDMMQNVLLTITNKK